MRLDDKLSNKQSNAKTKKSKKPKKEKYKQRNILNKTEIGSVV